MARAVLVEPEVEPDPTDEFDLASIIAAMPEKFLACRRQHSWLEVDVYFDREERTYVEVARCRSCKGVRRQLVDGSGFVIKTKPIDYPDGYLIKGLGHMTRADRAAMRVAYMQMRTEARMLRAASKGSAA